MFLRSPPKLSGGFSFLSSYFRNPNNLYTKRDFGWIQNRPQKQPLQEIQKLWVVPFAMEQSFRSYSFPDYQQQTWKLMYSNPDKLPSTFSLLPKTHTGPIYVALFNNQGEYCMTGSEDRSVCLYNPGKNLMIKQYKNVHNYDVYSLDISKDNSKFISGGGDKNIILTDVIQGKYIRKYTGHTSRVNSVTFNEDNNVIISASYDTSVRCWDNRNDSYHPIEIIKGFKDSVSKVIVMGAQIICSSMDGSMKVFDIRKGQVTTDKISEPIQRFDLANSRKAYVLSTSHNKLYLVEKVTGIKIQEYAGHKIGQFGVDVTFNTRDTHLLTGAEDGKLYIYDLMKKQPIKAIQAHKQVLSAISLHEIGGLVTASHDGTVAYWKI